MENEATDTRTVQFKNSTGKQKKALKRTAQPTTLSILIREFVAYHFFFIVCQSVTLDSPPRTDRNLKLLSG